MSTYTMRFGFLAPIPVGHRVQIDFYVVDWGILSQDFKLDRERPVVTDLETQIAWGHDMAWTDATGFGDSDIRRFHKSYYGRVLSCSVASRGGDSARLHTQLVIDPMEPPGAHGPYRSG